MQVVSRGTSAHKLPRRMDGKAALDHPEHLDSQAFPRHVLLLEVVVVIWSHVAC